MIRVQYISGATLKAIVLHPDGAQVWKVAATAGWVALSSATFADCVLTLAEAGTTGYYAVAFPGGITDSGQYECAWYDDPAGWGDAPVGVATVLWSGAAQVQPAAVGSAMTLATGAIVAGTIGTGALNGKGDWLLSSGYTAPPSAATIVSALLGTTNGAATVAVQLAHLNADVSTGGVTAQQVWEYTTRTITSGGGLTAQQVWEYATRTITAGGGLTAQQTRDAMKLAPTAGAAAAGSVDALLAAIPTAGSGAYTITLTVNDGTNPIAGAVAVFTSGVTRHEATTSALGVATFGLDAGAWTLSLSKSGYTYTPASYTVSATAAITRSMTAVAVTPSADPATTTGYLTVRDRNGAAVSGTTLAYRLISGPGDDGASYPRDWGTTSASATTTGLVQVTLVKGATYEFARDNGQVTEVAVPAAAGSTYELPEVMGLMED